MRASPSVYRDGLRTREWLKRDGWLRCALHHTWMGALLMLALGVGLGAALDRWVPQAESLPHAVRLWRAH